MYAIVLLNTIIDLYPKNIYKQYLAFYLARGGFGGAGGPVPPFKIFYLHVTATINSMKISFNDV